MQDYPAHIIDRLDPSSLLALAVVVASLIWLYRIVVRFGVFDAHQKINKAEGDGMPVAFVDALRENTQAKRDEKAAVEQMSKQVEILVSTIAANNRLMTETNKVMAEAGQDAAESLNILRSIEKSCINNTEGIRQTNAAVDRLNNYLVNVLSQRSK